MIHIILFDIFYFNSVHRYTFINTKLSHWMGGLVFSPDLLSIWCNFFGVASSSARAFGSELVASDVQRSDLQ